jgi:hypothetical protein
LGELVEAVVVCHPGLVKEDRRGRVDVQASLVRASDDRVQGQCVSGECWTVVAEPLGGRA